MTSNVWFCGIPGSRWSGIDIQMRSILACDRSDETPERTMYHRAYDTNDVNNGHRGSYWGPGMGCGEDWIDFNFLTKNKHFQAKEYEEALKQTFIEVDAHLQTEKG